MTDFALASPLARIVLGTRGDRASWQQLEVQTTSADMVKAEAELIKQKLDPQKHAYQVTCLAVYFALKAEGRVAGGAGAFLEQLIDVDVLNDDDDEGPIPPAPEAG